uniref:CHAT domain-containing protein n=1 Tax=Cyanothece sp. (strain PCC 7425 / ATCC 29141) TaxID=395961 RepID=B8HMM8_CYAP4
MSVRARWIALGLVLMTTGVSERGSTMVAQAAKPPEQPHTLTQPIHVEASRNIASKRLSHAPHTQPLNPVLAGLTPLLSPLKLAQLGQSDITNPIVPELIVPIGQGETGRVDLDNLPPAGIVNALEEAQSFQFASYFNAGLYGQTVTAEQIAERLNQLARLTGQRAAIIYTYITPKGLVLVAVLPQNSVGAQKPFRVLTASLDPTRLAQASSPDAPWLIRKQIPEALPADVQRIAREFRTEVSDPRKIRTTSYRPAAEQLYRWLVAPFKAELEANRIDTLVFCLDEGLRSLPVSALYDGQQFLVEQYNLALIPSFSLTNTRYERLGLNQAMLGMGISESTGGLSPLPAVAVEVPALTNQIWRGESKLNQQSTLDNLIQLTGTGQFRILHLATHAEFKRGDVNRSFIQLWNSRLQLSQLRQISRKSGWNPTLGLLVLSACQTALGSSEAELGFVGLAVQSGVETALGSLWRVSDEGSLGLMTGFYQQLAINATRSASLRQAQLAMLRGEIRINNGELRLPGQLQLALPAESRNVGNIDFKHPYYWSAFQLVGNWN